MKLYIYLLLSLCCIASLFLFGCKEPLNKMTYGNCADNIHNQNETRTDCGGVCVPCEECGDGIKNGSEIGLDCGGPDCQSCVAPCSVPLSTAVYTVNAKREKDTAMVRSRQDWSNTSFYVKQQGQISILLSDGILKVILIYFKPDFDLFSFLKIGETAIFTTVDGNATLRNDGQIWIAFFTTDVGTILRDQSVYITRLQDGTLQIRACLLKGDKKDLISFNGICVASN